MSSFQKDLVVKLDDSEVRARGQALADKLVEIDCAEESFKAVRAEHKDLLEALHFEKNELKRAVRDKQETRSVTCAEQHDEVALKVYTVRTDTGEVLSERAMTHAERQPNLLAIEGGKKKTKAAGEAKE